MARLVALQISVPVGGRDVEARVGLFAKATAVTSEDVDELVRRVREALRKSLRPIHALIIVAPSVDEEALQKLEAKCRELSLKLIVVRVPRVIDRVRLAAVGKAIEEFSSKEGVEPYVLATDLSKLDAVIDVDAAEVVLRDLAEGLSLAESLRALAREPIAITELALLPPIGKYEELVDAMKWFLYAPWRKASVSEYFRYISSNVMRFHLYKRGRKGVLGLDVESVDRLKEVAMALARNEFVTYDASTATVDTGKLNPIEERILRILEGVFDGVAHADSLRKFFVEVSSNSDRIWRALLSILELRGLICISDGSGKCPDAPGKGYVVLLKGDRGRRCVEEWLKSVESALKSIEGLELYGYVAIGKERGYRAFTLRELADFLRELSARAREISSIDTATAVRIARLARELAEYCSNTILPEVSAARSVIEVLRARLREVAQNIEEGINVARTLLEQYVATGSVSISLRILDELKKGLARLDEIVSMEIPSHEYAKIIEGIWSSNRGKKFPFNFSRLGPIYHFNYKLYLVHTELRSFIEIDDSGRLGISESLNEVVSKVEEAVTYIKSAIEGIVKVGDTRDLADVLSKCETLKSLASFVQSYRMARIEVKPIEASSASELFKAIKRIVDEWVERVNSDAKVVAELRSLATEVARLEREVVERCRSVEEKMKIVVDLLDRCPTQFDHATSCSAELDRVKELITYASDTIRKLSSGAIEVYSLRDVRDRVREVANVLRRVVDELREEKLDSCSRLLEEVKAKIDRLVNNVLTLGELLSRLKIETSIPFRKVCSEAKNVVSREDYGSACEVISKLSRLSEELRKLAIGNGVLTYEELDVYTAIEDMRGKASGRLRLSEAIAILVERLNMPPEHVKRLVLNLIDKGVLEVYL